MFYTIYKIINKLNGKYYIGMHKTNNLNDGYMGSGHLIKRAIKKHGIENFEKEILHIFDNEKDMKDKEKELVILDEMSYNICEGGKGGFGYINKNPQMFLTEKRLKSLTKVKERTIEQQNMWRENLSKSKESETWKVNQSLAQKKRIEERGSHWTGKNHKPETIEQMKLSAKGKHDGSKNSQYGTCWITNGAESKKIMKTDNIPDGWYRGRKIG